MEKNDGWQRYGELVLKELERLNKGQEDLKKDIDLKLDALKNDIANLKTTRSEVYTLRNWSDRVNEIWSPSQMAEAQKEIYKQKNNWAKALGILLAVEIVIGAIVAFKDYIFK